MYKYTPLVLSQVVGCMSENVFHIVTKIYREAYGMYLGEFLCRKCLLSARALGTTEWRPYAFWLLLQILASVHSAGLSATVGPNQFSIPAKERESWEQLSREMLAEGMPKEEPAASHSSSASHVQPQHAVARPAVSQHPGPERARGERASNRCSRASWIEGQHPAFRLHLQTERRQRGARAHTDDAVFWLEVADTAE